MLHLIRTEPDERTTELIQGMKEDQDHMIRLYEEGQNWDRIIDIIFEHEKIICWW